MIPNSEALTFRMRTTRESFHNLALETSYKML